MEKGIIMSFEKCSGCKKIPKILDLFEGKWYCTKCQGILTAKRNYAYYKKLINS
ncbi:hypothetical protein LCGC14_2376270 [marine sediment metagenome]|uniref:Uncharacterized protein n=1 Tax=marine sediment metagenome TaxID=412755 RepID=A0A0F9CPI9_9ZZZZ